MFSVEGMEHGEIELISPEGREIWRIRFKDVFSVTLDWCIERCAKPRGGSTRVGKVLNGMAVKPEAEMTKA